MIRTTAASVSKIRDLLMASMVSDLWVSSSTLEPEETVSTLIFVCGDLNWSLTENTSSGLTSLDIGVFFSNRVREATEIDCRCLMRSGFGILVML
ncbi:hypothetical protein OGAPHI_004326 [Ogataea philodendri]|uniref:Uncharacterized protein n=1 Tax=Ogataea philodendri TaxID=1378263 RepID=A0A9P8P6G4_9ASCO|nr:uncharacterized protein OGAPHI_004326 [Ogataea philodendri]KAH3666137.1 hypothetical protein OGAPHI_004326 [Ogataea philodendri]